MNIILGTKPTRQELTALSRLRQPEHAALAELIRSRLDDIKDTLVGTSDLDHLRRLQGQARVMLDFLDAIEKSPEVLERLK